MSERLTVLHLARRFTVQDAATTDKGREWLERVRPQLPELVRLYAARPLVRRHTERMLAHAATLADSPDALIDDKAIRALEAALAAIDATASDELRRLTAAVRGEAHRARGTTLREALQQPPPARARDR